MRHFVVVAALVILVAFGVYFGLEALHLMPVEASAQAVPIDWMWNLEIKAMSFLFALIFVPIIYSLIIFRRKKGDTSDGPHIEGNTPLEITWTVIPLVVVLIFAYLGAQNLALVRAVDPQAMEIKVKAYQWNWKFEYPAYGGFSSAELYLPVGKQVVLKMESTDVIHSFWVPEFRIKQDVVPGRVTEYRITPTLIGAYKVRCAELCGTSHSFMQSVVLVVSQGEFDTWVKQEQAKAAAEAAAAAGGGAPDPARGQKIAQDSGCLACHSINGTRIVGPSWKGIFGTTVKLTDGTTVTIDAAYIQQSILDPQSQVVEGYDPMVFNLALTDAQVADIIAFIQTLK
jgi:cytochrome c oxidase subunit 2